MLSKFPEPCAFPQGQTPLQKQAKGAILVHNHPSGTLKAGRADKDFTDLMIQACRLMKTPVLNHVIITEHSYFSFKETGLLERLECSNKYVLSYELERQFHEEAQAAIEKIKIKSKIKIKERPPRRREERDKDSCKTRETGNSQADAI